MVSIIVPVLNEEENVEKLQQNFKRLQGEFEVVFCDGGSTDSTLEKIEPEYRIVVGKKGRGFQMNCGADAAKGEVFFFIHCDVELEEDVLNKITEDVRYGKKVGYLKLGFDSERFLMKICAFMSGVRASRRKIIYGDQGIIINKQLFYEIGGIPKIPLMEDLELSLQLKKRKILLEEIPSRIVTSARRFEKRGIVKTMWQMQKLQMRYLQGGNVNNMLEEYKDIR